MWLEQTFKAKTHALIHMLWLSGKKERINFGNTESQASWAQCRQWAASFSLPLLASSMIPLFWPAQLVIRVVQAAFKQAMLQARSALRARSSCLYFSFLYGKIQQIRYRGMRNVFSLSSRNYRVRHHCVAHSTFVIECRFSCKNSMLSSRGSLN